MTLAKAAELPGISLGEFIDLLRSKQIPWMNYTEEHLEDDERAIRELLGNHQEEQ